MNLLFFLLLGFLLFLNTNVAHWLKESVKAINCIILVEITKD